MALLPLHADIYPRIANVEELKRELVVLEKRVASMHTRINARLKLVQDAIAGGETTGDPLRDLVIRAHGLDKALEDKYRKLQAALTGKKGEFVLLSFHADIPWKFGGRSIETREAQCYRLGVLEGEELVWVENESSFLGPQISLFVSRYTQGETHIFFDSKDLKRPLLVEKENIFTHGFSSASSYPPLLHQLLGGEWQESIIIGDRAVKAWLKKKCMSGLYKPAADALSKLILEPTEN